MLINILFFLRIHIVLGENWSPILEIGKEQTLVTSGPYKYVRHPMYTCFFVHAITLWLITANHLVGAVAFSSFAIIYPIRVVAEEKMMIEQFGKSYEDYIKKTGRLWPKLF
jgi:protein-S-isoprenylcysteine O-methyltransferase Ste14